MKTRNLTFIIGILVGAILAVAGFLAYNKSINKDRYQRIKPTENKGQIQRPNGNMGEPPEKTNGRF